MSTRTIKLKLLTQTGVVKIESALRTFGELKQDAVVKKLGIDWNNAKLIDKDTRATFDLDDSIIPAIDCILFVTPTKTKSGADLPYKEVKQKIKEFKEDGGEVPFNYTQATTADLNAFWNKVSKAKPKAKEEVKSKVETKKEVTKKTTLTPIVDEEVVEEVKKLLAQGLKLQAIKLVKDFTDMDLREAKDFVDSLRVKDTTKEEEIVELIPSIPLENIVDVVTKEDLQREAEEIKSLVNKR